MPAGIPFPIELTEEILNICSDDTLISAACVNSRYHNIATRLLYRYVEIDISYQKALRLLKTLSSNPTLAGHVRSLSFPDPLKGINTIETPLIAFNALLRRCFSNLHNLDRLEFNLERYSPSIFQESTFRLDSVILYFGKDSPPLTWLEVQSDLTMLTVFQLPSHGEGAIRSFSIFSPTALPKLVDVRATGQNAVELATGRPVVSVTLMCPGEDGRSLAKGTLPLLGQVAPRLEVLKFTLREVDVLDMLTALAMHFPNIVEIQFSAFLYTYGQVGLLNSDAKSP
jgi:hypothetical protein